ncbi:MAG: glutamate mutase L, partial [Chloroflexota bacterium]
RQTVLREAGAEAVAAWLPLDVDEVTLRHDARLGAAVPAALPESVDHLLVEYAYAREALRLLVDGLIGRLGHVAGGRLSLPPVDLIIGSGGVLAGAPRLTQAALILLDAVQPDALTQLALDRATALPLLGRLGLDAGPGALGAALERDGLLNLGLCIAPVGAGKEGEPAIKVEVVYSSRSPVTVEVPVGAIEVVPLPIGERASLKLWPAREFDVGLGPGAAATPRAEVEGGAVGIIVDARGRPLTLPESAEKRQAKLLQWLQATGAYPQFSFVHTPPTTNAAIPAALAGDTGDAGEHR